MTEPVPGQTPEPAVTDAAAATRPGAGTSSADRPHAETPNADRPDAGSPAAGRSTEPAAERAGGPLPGTTGAAQAAPVEAAPDRAPDSASDSAPDHAAGHAPDPAADPAPEPAPAAGQDVFGGLSLAAIEADIDRLMSDKMSELDGMLAGLEELVQRLEGEITQLEPPGEDTSTP
ncbi:hypothetical protein [Saccharothrix sp. Mg75]|uniref:hypothetical protein n=1 Tax=Saccharothrix sp. Mg75 TaxID=3445357 RepID=UPI003EEC46BD